MPLHRYLSPLPWRPALLSLMMAGGLQAEVWISASSPVVMSGNLRVLRVHAQGDAPGERAWRWQVVEDPGQTLEPDGAGTGAVRFQAPEVGFTTVRTIRVVDAGNSAATAELRITVIPRIDVDPLIAETILPNLIGADYLVGKMHRFARLEAPAASNGDLQMPAEVAAACFVANDGDMGDLNNKWIVAHLEGITVLDGLGHRVRELENKQAHMRNLVARPAKSLRGNPFHVVASSPLGVSVDQGVVQRRGGGHGIWSLGPGHQWTLLAGRPRVEGEAVPFRNGKGAEALFGAISGLAMDRGGTLYVADAGNGLIRVVTPQGEVSTLAGREPDGSASSGRNRPRAEDGQHHHAVFGDLGALALDPRTGDLYVIDGHSVRRVTRHGEVTTVLGNPAQRGFHPGHAQEAMEAGLASLNRPLSLQVVADTLLITDRGNHCVRTFDLRTHIFGTFLGGPNERHVRTGPVWGLSRHLDPHQCAALPSPSALAVRSDGTCLVSHRDELFAVDLGGLTIPRAPDRR